MYGADVYRLRAVEQRPWAELYDAFPDVPSASLRRIFYEERQERGELGDRRKAPVPFIEGVTAYDEIDEGEVLRRALQEWQGTKRQAIRKRNQSIEFDHGPVCIVNLGDQHMG